METLSLNATLRPTSGKGGARKVRAAGQLPAVVYRAGETSTAVVVDPHALELAFKKSKNPNSLVELNFDDGSKKICLVREAQRHPVNQVLRHVDFFEVDNDTPVVITVPIALHGRAAGIRAGGVMTQVARQLSVRCKPADIPATIPVDITPIEIGQALRVSEVPAPAGCTILYKVDSNVVYVMGKQETKESGKA